MTNPASSPPEGTSGFPWELHTIPTFITWGQQLGEKDRANLIRHLEKSLDHIGNGSTETRVLTYPRQLWLVMSIALKMGSLGLSLLLAAKMLVDSIRGVLQQFRRE